MATTAAGITDAAMAVLEEVGLDGLSMRAVARRVGVQVGGLYHHLPDKQALLRAMADRICQAALELAARPSAESSSGEPGWRVEARRRCAVLRQVMLAHRDGARLVLHGPLVGSPGALALMEELTTALTRSGRPAGHVRVTADTLMSYVTGFVLQEQLGTAAGGAPAADLSELAARYPLVFHAGGGVDAMTADDLFDASTDLILNGMTSG